ncbi:MAG TPA: protein-L-isoaspartate(D-aspartate) O-methyltransferase [Candidatus Aenigmarchaeota archaeon]|nr:protein-L-isoaspartate(D-aspartate) O-methyltransferase [Candidatus Aenigmarchaeota archaeon]
MEFERERKKLVNNLVSFGVLRTKRIIEAFLKIPRHLFVTKDQLPYAYVDVALPTLKNSTISQPSTVAIMTEALQPKEGDKILEVGTGSGWQAAILSYCVGENGRVITIEIDKDLVEFARKNLKKVGIKNVKVIHGDGGLGYEKEAPYDGCIITAACPRIPPPIIKQTKVNGRIVAPIGTAWEQRVILAVKEKYGKLKKIDLGAFVFVPMRGSYGFSGAGRI